MFTTFKESLVSDATLQYPITLTRRVKEIVASQPDKNKNESKENNFVDLNEEDTFMFKIAIAKTLNQFMVTENNFA